MVQRGDLAVREKAAQVLDPKPPIVPGRPVIGGPGGSGRGHDDSIRSTDLLQVGEHGSPILDVFQEIEGDDQVSALDPELADEVLCLAKFIHARTFPDIHAKILCWAQRLDVTPRVPGGIKGADLNDSPAGNFIG